MTTQLFLGVLLGVLIGITAYRLHALSRSGAWAAAITGGMVFGLGGFPWAMLLLTFFISSSVLSRTFARRKAALSEKFSKGSQRDWGQVLANGGLGAFLAIVHSFSPDSTWPWIAYSGALAAVNADTWATELGVFSPTQPRLITNGRSVESGTSGGVTLLGYIAALGGAILVGMVAVSFTHTNAVFTFVAFIVLAGLAGSTFDSILGASVQAIYYCPECQKETERHPQHTCGMETRQARGWRWLNNDLVNFACSLAGGIVAVVLWGLIA